MSPDPFNKQEPKPASQPSNIIRVWLLTAGPMPKGLQKAVLSQQEQNQADCIQHPETRNSFIRSRVVLRLCLAQHLRQKPRSLQLEHTPWGKPFLPEYPNVFFNLSHTRGALLVAITDVNQIGVDIETTFYERPVAALARRYFSQASQDALSELPKKDQRAAFLRLWTQFEAYQKGIGEGLRGHYAPISYNHDLSADNQLHALHTDKGQTVGWSAGLIQTEPAFIAALAIKQSTTDSLPRLEVKQQATCDFFRAL